MSHVSEFTFNDAHSDKSACDSEDEGTAFSKLANYETGEIKSIGSLPSAHQNPQEIVTKYDKDDIVVELKVVLAKVERDMKKHCKFILHTVRLHERFNLLLLLSNNNPHRS